MISKHLFSSLLVEKKFLYVEPVIPNVRGTCGNVLGKSWFGPVKGYSLLDQMTSRNLSTSSVEYVNVL